MFAAFEKGDADPTGPLFVLSDFWHLENEGLLVDGDAVWQTTNHSRTASTQPRPAASFLLGNPGKEGGNLRHRRKGVFQIQATSALLVATSRVAFFRVRRRRTTSRRQEGNHPIEGLPRTLP
jgi:hypothetical protein